MKQLEIMYIIVWASFTAAIGMFVAKHHYHINLRYVSATLGKS
jgi:hypothetical protein